MNENLVIKNEQIDEKSGKKITKIKFQLSLYKLFMVYVIGELTLTTVIIKKARKYGFYIALMSTGFKLYELIGSQKEGNTLLHEKQYKYEELDIAKHIIKNKIMNQRKILSAIRGKDESLKQVIASLDNCLVSIGTCNNIYTLLAIEGNASKLYFREHFKSIEWKGRKPRIKSDIANSILDIAYTLLFTFIESIVLCFGFDIYKGVYHKQFYMRKSLICDLVEPFRCLMDKQVLKSYHLKQINEKDFIYVNKQYKLKWENSKYYVAFLMQPLLDEKENIFMYIQGYYRAFMKEKNIEEYPMYELNI